jgi:hypothetical protein
MNIAMSEKLVRHGHGWFVDFMVPVLANRGKNRQKMDLPRAFLWLSSTYQILKRGTAERSVAIPGTTDSRLVEVQTCFLVGEISSVLQHLPCFF